MTTQTRNEAAERLHDKVARYVPDGVPLLDAALAAERRATVERIKTTVLLRRNRQGNPFKDIYVPELLAILDDEATGSG